MNAGSFLRCTACLASRVKLNFVAKRSYQKQKAASNVSVTENSEGRVRPVHPSDAAIESHKSVLNRIFPPGSFASLEFFNWYQSDWEFSWRSIQRWYSARQYQLLLDDQKFIEERHMKLGYDLATAHFLLHRFGAVKFVGRQEWIAPGDEQVGSLPDLFDRKFRLEAIDVSGSTITYEGLENLMQLRHLRWLNISNCEHLDDFCMDQISSEYGESLEFLDISGCPLITTGGVTSVTKLRNLRVLRMRNLPRVENLNLLCLMLEEAMPNLKIDAGVDFDDPMLFDQETKGKEVKFLDPPPPETPFLCIGDMDLDPNRLIMHKIDFHYEVEPRLSAHLMLGDWVPPGYENYVPPANLKRLMAARTDGRRIEVFGKLEDAVKIEEGEGQRDRPLLAESAQ